jgi:hypothetical protein
MRLSGIAGLAFVLATALVNAPASAQQTKTVGDVTVRFGLVTALEAEHADAQHGAHKGGHGSGMEHLLVSLSDAKSGSRISGANIVVEVKDPKGKLQSKPLQAMVTAGAPDYSEVFEFGWTGKYAIRMKILLQGATKPLEARFTLNRVI